MEQYRFAGYRVINFPSASRVALSELAERLTPHETEIVEKWIGMQFNAWQPPGLTPEQLNHLFGGLFHNMLRCMTSSNLEDCIVDLEEAGASLARSNFPYEALIVSLHFLEESYMPFLLNPRSERTQEWLIRMDEFLHVGIAALATSYFQFNRDQLLADAEVGRVVQEALFPNPPRKIGDLELGFIYASASERARLGGDFLDVFRFGGSGTAFVVGDLSGHGLEAAAGSATIRSIFKGFTRDRANLPDVMKRLNQVLTEELEDHQFATALAGTYEAPGHLVMVNAGNPSPVFRGEKCCMIQQVSLPLGVDQRAEYGQKEIELKPGDVFVCYTDGLSEARTGGDMFGDERILEAVEEMHDAPARAIAEHLKDKAVRHANGRLMDDMAILVLKRTAAS
jgi:serine phosphatase RsbU (regulator of sigma subunit)